jgi:GntR family transcriptional regulator
MLESISPVRKDIDEPPTLQVYRALVRLLQEGRFSPGSKMPPERELAAQLDVSRVTVRHALSALQHEGFLRATQGSGWYVAEGIVEESHDELTSFTEIARGRGLRPTSQVLVQVVRAATLEEADQLRIAPGARLFHLERLRLLDHLPVALALSLIPHSIAQALVDLDFTERSLYEALRDASGTTPWRADYVIQARGATDEEARWLDLPAGAPVLQGSDITVDAIGRPVELGRVVYRGDRYRFRTTLRHVARGPIDEEKKVSES